VLPQHPDDLLLAEAASFHRPSPFSRRTLPQKWLSFRGARQAAIQPEGRAEVLGTVVRGNTTIIFQAAGTHGLDLNRLRSWSQFAEEHPKIATALAYKPSLINDPGYLTKHPELPTFFQTHLDIKDAIKENPGNFAAIPPRPGE
jgi:hypothetical protein